MDHINNGPYQLLKKDPTTKIKTKTLNTYLADTIFTIKFNIIPCKIFKGSLILWGPLALTV